MKYDSQLQEVKNKLASAKNVVVLLPSQVGIDELAAGLALYLALEQTQKKAVIATEDIIRVGDTNLFGVGQIQNKLPQAAGGDLTIVLSNVATPDGKIPAVERMDYNASGADLHLIFKVYPGQRFEPTSITPKYSEGSYEMIFVLGASTLNNLGSLYTANPQAFSGVYIVNIDNKPANTHFGSANVVDIPSSLSEMVLQVLVGLQLTYHNDISTNILSGIFAATNNLQSINVNADTYSVVAEALRAGGQKPVDLGSKSQVRPTQASGGSVEAFTVPPVVFTPDQQPELQGSPEERPAGEEVQSPSPDWLTPKVYRGGGSFG